MHQETRLKIVHVVVAGDIGGAERFLVNLTSRPQLSGADHCIALMTPNPELRAFFLRAGLRVRDRGLVRENPAAYLWRSYGPVDFSWLCMVAEEEKADLFHAHTYGSHVLAARAGLRLNLPVVRTEHGVRHYRDPSCALNRLWAIKHTTRIVAVSAFVAKVVEVLAPEAREKVQVVRNGIDMTNFPPAPPSSAGNFTIVSVSRLDAIKRTELAVTAVAQVPDVVLNIVGDGGERGRLQRLVEKRGLASRVRFLGHLEDPRPAIEASDAVISCTREEGLGLAVIEAAAMQRPAIAFVGGGIPEIVQDGRTGWLVREDTPDHFAAAVADASSDRARAAQFGRNAREWVVPRFNIDDMCKGYATVYKELSRGYCQQSPQ